MPTIVSPSAAQPLPEAADGVVLMLSKTWDSGSGTWQLGLSWSGGTSPYTVSYSTDASFQRGDRTLAANTAISAMTVAATASATLECFAITDANGVSPSEQGSGYDPYPDIPPATIQQNGLWWGDTLTLNGNYYDMIPQENFLGLAARNVQAASVTGGGNGYANSASFTIPDDGRGAYAFVATHGRFPPSAPFIHLYPRNIPAYTSIRCIVYAPQTGHVWVAADSRVDEIDIFEHDPVILHTLTAYTKPYLSRCTSTGKILVVDGVSGVGEIDQIDVNSGAVSLYAHTTDTANTPNFTRTILPVGVAADPDGSAAYVADATGGAGASTPVRFPSGNASAITDNYGNWPYWSFPDPVGIDVGLTHQLSLGCLGSPPWAGYVTAPGSAPGSTKTYYQSDLAATPHAYEMDLDISTASDDRYYYSDIPNATVYNKNALPSIAAQGTSPRYLGGGIWADNGKLSLQLLFNYAVQGNAPKAVILNNSNQGYPFPGLYQVADRLVQLSVKGWQGLPVHLRLIDPPDIAAYAPPGGWASKGAPAVPPYEANDNDVWSDSSNTDWGLSAAYPGTLNRNLEIDVTPGSSRLATFYLKLPARYAGDNWQIEVRKKSPAGTLVPNEIASYSPIFTGWKRVYVERDHMFRRGNLFDADVLSPPAGQLYLALWDTTTPITDASHYVQPGDHIVVFDTDHSYPSGTYEFATIAQNPPPQCYAAPLPGGGTKNVLLVYLDHNLVQCYTASPMDFSSGKSAAIGVIQSADGTIYDTAPNQINGTGSAFYDADTRDIKQPFDDAFTQFIFPRSGMGAVPYINESIPFYDPGLDNGPEQANRLAFETRWSIYALNYQTPNYLYLLGCKGRSFTGASLTAGITSSSVNHYSYIYINSLDTYGQAQVPPYTPQQAMMAVQYDTDHEFGHQFNTNNCTTPPCSGATPHHDNRSWWNYDATGCPAPNPCLEEYSLPNPPTGTNKLCKDDLLLGDQNCSGTPRPGAVRTYPDPLP